MGLIVLADDDDDLRAVYGPFLRTLGHQVHEARSGREAIELVRQHRPDLLILDVWMPESNGFEVLEQLRPDSLTAQMRILMLSNIGDADTRLECFEMGATDYLVKGMALPDFGAHVENLLRAATGPNLDPPPPLVTTDRPDASTA